MNVKRSLSHQLWTRRYKWLLILYQCKSLNGLSFYRCWTFENWKKERSKYISSLNSKLYEESKFNTPVGKRVSVQHTFLYKLFCYWNKWNHQTLSTNCKLKLVKLRRSSRSGLLKNYLTLMSTIFYSKKETFKIKKMYLC